ncbi:MULTISPECIES: ABC transporter ATP-binding protein [unclassified Nocardiopsis]|uniref:ABC transporter ATP-binding protein n=1 Tax=Nocardiopsis TaxID=2013 RepID=UPI00387B47CD
MRRSRKRAAAPASGPAAGPEIKPTRYYPWVDQLQRLSAWTIVTRLPRMIAHVLRVAWRADRRDTVLTLALHTAAGIVGAIALVVVARVLEDLLSDAPTAERLLAALPSLALLAATLGLRGMLNLGAGWAQERLGPQVEREMELELFSLTSRVRLEAYDDSDYNDSLARGRDRGVYESSSLIANAIDVLSGLIGLLAIAGVLAVLHPLLTPLLVVAVLPTGWAAMRAARIRYTRLRELTTTARRRYIVGDLLAGRGSATEVRAYNMAPGLLREYTRIADHVRAVLLEVARRQTLVRATGGAVGAAALLGVYAALVALLLNGHMPLAIAGAAYVAIGQGTGALDRLTYALTRTYESGLYVDDVYKVCERTRELLPRPGRRDLPGGLEVLTVEDVHFAYPGQEREALRGVSLTVRKGEVVALVGENGSGKSTLAKLIAALYTPARGRITWNGVDGADIHADQVRARIGFVSQDYTQMPFTALRNITMGGPGDPVDRDRLERSLVLSGADEVVASLDQGLDTILDKRFVGGADLSGGQRQRIAAARGLYPRADLVIADEPTAALDARAEKRLFDTLQAAAEDASVLLITHRLASVRRADTIVVLSEGRVVEQGDHAALMARGGLYAELFRIQADAYRGLSQGLVGPEAG